MVARWDEVGDLEQKGKGFKYKLPAIKIVTRVKITAWGI